MNMPEGKNLKNVSNTSIKFDFFNMCIFLGQSNRQFFTSMVNSLTDKELGFEVYKL